MKKICDRKDCTGCFACYNACPKNAIEMKEDKFGNIYPEINQEKCINCGLCKKTCPQLNQVSFNEPITAYAMYNKDSKIRKESTSGGAATTFYLKVLDDGGVVYGANNIENSKFRFIRITKKSDLTKVKGSKYVHCYIEDKYSLAKQDLIKGLKVLFIGTPCQIAGLRSFLGKEYDNLLTVDLVCHGVPSQQFLIDEIKMHGIDSTKIDKVVFRDNDYILKIYRKEQCLYTQRGNDNNYIYRFLNSQFNRENCYNCKYARSGRISDITIGDFWGLKSEKDYFKDKSSGISLVLVNTKKGDDFVKSCFEDMAFEERPIDEALNGNSQLNHPAIKHKYYDKFMKTYAKCGYEEACKKTRNFKQILKSIKIINDIYKKLKGR